ncbi:MULTISPECIES: TetR/AcrR family transcriptional regulator [Aquimarina]|uniref:TetR family transcriptional regulator n=2 Tax=Aquimarina algiphila TaxID=2047982 RepID=A0A554VK20_9FLAO|nr:MULTISPECIES: TetR/AcrR family transcriptional regulator [Aquimarina]TSE08300.1 TetR family transcriptional regulator [Aquimarina algiphila]
MKKETVDNILAIGTDLVLKKGYNNLGILEVLETAKIPKGSFYYYFKSKEDFGIQLIKYYSEHSLKILNSYLKDTSKNPRERLLSFFNDMKNVYSDKGFKEGCLLGNCSLELSDVSESFSTVISSELDKWQFCFEDCIIEGQNTGVISADKSSVDMSNFILSGWEGAILRMKSSKNNDAIEVFIQYVSKYIL